MSEMAIRQPLAANKLSLRLMLGQAVRLAFLWMALGFLLGGFLGMDGGIAGILAFATAGAVVTPLLGAVLGLAGGQVKETLFGAIVGAIVGTSLALFAKSTTLPYGFGVGLIVGGMVGAASALSFWRARRQTNLPR